MNLKPNDLETLCKIATQAAQEAGKIINEYTGTDFNINHKKSGSSPASQIVSEVDFKSQEIILKHLHPSLEKYDLGLLSEELEDDGSRFEKDYFWCIDPLDGTLPFTENRPGYAVSIALVSKDGHAIIGVVFNPITKTLYHAIRDFGAFKNEVPWPSKASVSGIEKEINQGGAVMNAIWVLEQAPAYFLKKPKREDGCGCLWDYAATACIFKEMGAKASDSFLKPLRLNNNETVFMNRTGVHYRSTMKESL